jgi:hypothetical protein
MLQKDHKYTKTFLSEMAVWDMSSRRGIKLKYI